MEQNLYRLVWVDGNPHPILDTPYESFDAAIGAAKDWSTARSQDFSHLDRTIGIEVSTSNGSWRTIKYS